jgi:Fe-S cluster assembly protein SufD
MTDAPVIIKRTLKTKDATDFPLSEKDIPLTKNADVNELRQKAWQTYQSIPFPTTAEEAWRRTDLSSLDKGSYQYDLDGKNLLPIDKRLLHPLASDVEDGQVILQPGHIDASLADIYIRQGVVFCTLEQAIELHAELIQDKLGSIVPATDGKFAALNTAMAKEGVFLYVPRGVCIDHPLHSIFWASGEKSIHFSRMLVWLEEGADVTLVNEYASSEENSEDFLHCGVIEVFAGEEARLKFVELQSWGPQVTNIMHQRISAQTNAKVDIIVGAMGSLTTKDFTDYNLAGRGSTIRASGFYFADHDQHFDHDTQQNHLVPDTTSDLLYKGAVTGNSRSVWQGMIYVAPGAAKTDGYQANRNLVLSSTARADSIPGLEILADDVRCTHGATVGKVDPEQIYYLQARGLSYIEAKRLIVEGFFEPIMERIPFEGVKERFRQEIQNKMDTIKA